MHNKLAIGVIPKAGSPVMLFSEILRVRYEGNPLQGGDVSGTLNNKKLEIQGEYNTQRNPK